jgi:hypothetical protein
MKGLEIYGRSTHESYATAISAGRAITVADKKARPPILRHLKGQP